MAKTKYGDHVVTMSSSISRYFMAPQFSWGSVRVAGELLGLHLAYSQGYVKEWHEYGSYPYRPHVHNFDEVLLYLGSDPEDISKLNAEAENCGGWEEELHVFTRPGVCVCPKGWPHCPVTIAKVTGPFQFGLLSFADRHWATKMPLPKEPLITDGTKYNDYFIDFSFRQDPSIGKIATVKIENLRRKNLVIEYMMCNKAFKCNEENPQPEIHDFNEVYLFTSGNHEDATYLMGEAEIALGKEEEIHKITLPTAILAPKGLPHLPLTVTKVDKPFMIMKLSFADKPTTIKMR